MTERDLCTTLLNGGRVQNSASKPGTERAESLAFRHVLFNDRVRIFLDYPERNAELGQIIRKYLFGEPRLFLIEVDGEDLKIYRRSFLNVEQQIKHRVTVFA